MNSTPEQQQIKNTMRARLMEKGLTVEGWAREQGYGEGVAAKIVVRFVGKNKRPKGPVATKIIEGLETETGLRLCG